jgi:murein DD-endopeptidase MepM/ murein hydrolase activator NlpD
MGITQQQTAREALGRDGQRPPHRGRRVLGMAGLLVFGLGALFALLSLAPVFDRAEEAEPSLPVARQVPVSSLPDVRRLKMGRGDTLARLLRDEGFSHADAAAVTLALRPVFDAARLRGGQMLTLVFTEQPQGAMHPVLQSVAFKPSVERDIAVVRLADGRFEARAHVKTLQASVARAKGVIRGSLYQSALEAGAPDGVIVDMIRIYSHAVDFQREIRPGDGFDILYRTYTDENGKALRSGAIDFVQLSLSGALQPLYRFKSQAAGRTDYYTPGGKSGRRLLMRTPVDGARLSSGFGMRRHPVLGYSKMHKGVDFAAPSGTPIMAAGGGVVRKARWFGSFGKYVRIAHANGYETAYAHLSRIAPGVREGARVRQGQIIGRVGTTGRSTGPHLHYEVIVGRRQINPMGVKLPTGTTLAGAELAAFRAHVARVNAVLDKWGETPALVAEGEILRAQLSP